MTPDQLTDGRGLAVSTRSKASASAYVQGVDLFIRSSPEAIAVLRAAVDSDRQFQLARVALACALAAASMPDETLTCDCVPLSCGPSTRRERQHIEVVRLVLSGDRERATVLGREHLHEFPSDVLVAHMLASLELA